jgi:hypothetical protein
MGRSRAEAGAADRTRRVATVQRADLFMTKPPAINLEFHDDPTLMANVSSASPA